MGGGAFSTAPRAAISAIGSGISGSLCRGGRPAPAALIFSNFEGPSFVRGGGQAVPGGTRLRVHSFSVSPLTATAATHVRRAISADVYDHR